MLSPIRCGPAFAHFRLIRTIQLVDSSGMNIELGV